MGLFDQLENGTAARGSARRCGVEIVCEKLDAADADQLHRVLAMDAEVASAAAISRALKESGHHIAAASLNRHRRRECLCDAA